MYEDMSLVQLRETAKKLGMKGISALKKNELIEKLNNTADTTAAASKKSSDTAMKTSRVKKNVKDKNEKTEENQDINKDKKTAKVKSDNNKQVDTEIDEDNNAAVNNKKTTNMTVVNTAISNIATSNTVEKNTVVANNVTTDAVVANTSTTSVNTATTSTTASNNVYRDNNRDNSRDNNRDNSRDNNRGNNRGNNRDRYDSSDRNNNYRQSNERRGQDDNKSYNNQTMRNRNNYRNQNYQNNGQNSYQNNSQNSYQNNSQNNNQNNSQNNSQNNNQNGYQNNNQNNNQSSSQGTNQSYQNNGQVSETNNYSNSGQNNTQNSQSYNQNSQKIMDNSHEHDSGEIKEGILEVLPEGYAFIRCDNYLPGDNDVYVSPAMIRKYGLRTGDIIRGNTRTKNQNEKFSALLYISQVNGFAPDEIIKRNKFETLTPIFPKDRIRLETKDSSAISMRMMDLISPIGKGQRGMIVSQPKTGKTTLLKQVAKSVKTNYPEMHIIVLLIDERPEEVTDIKESIMGNNVDVIYSTFDELPENHKRVSEMVIERAKRLVEHGEDVIILLDSITRLARAYNLTVSPSGRTLSGGLDPAALHMPKKFFGAARNMREGGSLTILATALVDTGSKMDDVVFEEFKGTGNMEIVLDRSLSEKRLFPAIDLPKSSTRRDDLLLRNDEIEANFLMRRAFSSSKSDEAVEKIIKLFKQTKDNNELIQMIRKIKIV